MKLLHKASEKLHQQSLDEMLREFLSVEFARLEGIWSVFLVAFFFQLNISYPKL